MKNPLTESGAMQDLQAARDKLQGEFAEIANDANTALRRRGGELAEVSSDYVRDNPLKTLAFAAGAGLLVGLLLARR